MPKMNGKWIEDGTIAAEKLSGVIDLGVSGNINNLTLTGNYYVGASGTTLPSAHAYYIQHINYDANNALQIASFYAPSTVSTMYRRVKVAGAWKTWYRWRSDAETGYIGNPDLTDMAANTIKGRVTASTGDPEDLTVAQAISVLSSTRTGFVPRPVYNFSTGVLVATNIPDNQNTMAVIEIKGSVGDSGGSGAKIINVVGFVYAYTSSITWNTAVSTGQYAPVIDAFYYNGYLHFFFEQPSLYCGFLVTVKKTFVNGGTAYGENCLTDITNAAKPSSGVTYSIVTTAGSIRVQSASSLPTASNRPHELLGYDNKLYWSNGTSWVEK